MWRYLKVVNFQMYVGKGEKLQTANSEHGKIENMLAKF